MDMRLPGPAGGQHGEEKDAGFSLSSGQMEWIPRFQYHLLHPQPSGACGQATVSLPRDMAQPGPCHHTASCSRSALLLIFCSQTQVMAQQGCCGDLLSRPTEQRLGKWWVQLTIYLLVGLQPVLRVNLHISGTVSIWILVTESSRKASISALLTMPKPLTVWITINCGKFWKRCEYQTCSTGLYKDWVKTHQMLITLLDI